ncbi:MAG: sigma-70 family RNA polymerase sigma factor [Thermoanaerobaculia bacterium]|nr:sigma-70 family RNA polymerase sigma factor [Thermoanaerobaculia bacterium]
MSLALVTSRYFRYLLSMAKVAPNGAEVTRLLADWNAGDRAAADRVFGLLYEELRRVAHHALADQHREATLQTTALVHELYARWTPGFAPSSDDRRRFFGAAAKTMRRILIDRARERLATKRGGGVRPTTLDTAAGKIEARAAEALAVDEALAALERHDARLGEIFELRFFGGFSVDETAELLDLSPRTVKRDWQKARALLADWMAGSSAAEE